MLPAECRLIAEVRVPVRRWWKRSLFVIADIPVRSWFPSIPEELLMKFIVVADGCLLAQWNGKNAKGNMASRGTGRAFARTKTRE